MSNEIRNLVFDLGNVIVDIDVEGAHARLGSFFRPDADEPLIHKAFIDYESGKLSTDLFINTILKQCDRKYQAIDIIGAWNSMLTGIPKHRLDMLMTLRKHYNVFALSNTNPMHLEWMRRYVRKEYHVESFDSTYFDTAYFSHLVGDIKPNASIFKFIRDDAGIVPQVTLFMDDIQKNVESAASIGFQTYLVTPGEEVGDYLKQKGLF
jgi:putative hydrolase of the HAD superfamily